MTQTPGSVEVPRLEGWLTLTEIAERAGITRQAASAWAARGAFATLHRIGSFHIVAESEASEWVARRASAPVQHRTFGLSRQMTEILIAILNGRVPYEYPQLVRVARALRSRGLVEHDDLRLTKAGRDLAEHIASRSD